MGLLKFVGFIGFILLQSWLVYGEEKCYTVKAGSFYSTLVPFYGLNSNKIVQSWIRLDANTAHYLFKSDDPKGHLCSTSWNKLYGTVRCGVFNSNHQDSDRFVWRRAQNCLNLKEDYVLGEVADCEESGLIEIAAYAYDNGDLPFSSENQGRLLKIFSTKVEVEKWYLYKLTMQQTSTIYEIFDEDGTTLLEQQIIDHRNCGNSYASGALQSLYFGGQCPAPQPVTACYRTV